jgi:hypothetical protein
MKLRNSLTAAATALLAFGAFAQAASTQGIDARQTRQETRIEKGVASGALTSTEVKRLDAKEERVVRLEHRAKADDRVTQDEKARIVHTQNKASRAIKRQKHDAQTSAPAGK